MDSAWPTAGAVLVVTFVDLQMIAAVVAVVLVGATAVASSVIFPYRPERYSFAASRVGSLNLIDFM